MNAIITCVNYADYLRRTLPLNLRHFERVLVVTTAEDEATRRMVAEIRFVANRRVVCAGGANVWGHSPWKEVD